MITRRDPNIQQYGTRSCRRCASPCAVSRIAASRKPRDLAHPPPSQAGASRWIRSKAVESAHGAVTYLNIQTKTAVPLLEPPAMMMRYACLPHRGFFLIHVARPNRLEPKSRMLDGSGTGVPVWTTTLSILVFPRTPTPENSKREIPLPETVEKFQ